MQPLGRKPKRYNFEDCHPGKGFVNWWESPDGTTSNKKASRREAKKQIEEERLWTTTQVKE